MRVNDKNIDVNEAIKYADYEKLLLKRRGKGLLLSDYQVSVLKRSGIDYEKYLDIRGLLFDIEEYLNEMYDEELDNVSKQIYEYIYYNESRK